MKARSITARVVTIILLSELVAASAVSVLVFARERRSRLHALDATIRGRCDSLLGAVQDAEDEGDHVFVDPAELRLPATDLWLVLNTTGGVVGSSGPASPALSLHAQDGQYDQQIAGISYRVLERHALRIIDRDETAGAGIRRPVILLYASPRTHLVHEALEGASSSMLTVLLVSALTALLVAVFLRASLQPVKDLSVAAERLTLTNLRFDSPASAGGIAELRPLAATLSAVTEKLREAFEREQQFVGDAAHELKTSLAVLRSTIQVTMLKNRAPEEYRSGLHRALEDTQRLETLVQQMLSLARVEEARDSQEARTSLGEAARQALAQLGPIAESEGVELMLVVEEGTVVPLPTERAFILVTNLVSNAIQHSRPQSAVAVSIAREGEHIHLRVQDSGDGIDAAALPHVFERFYRADPARARQTGGTGLGLAICRSIVERAGGRIEIASTLHAGTTVHVAFRVA